MPAWLEKIIVDLVLKQLTPEAVAAAEKAAATFVITKLAELAKSTPSDIDDTIVAKLAQIFGVDVPAA